MLSMPCILSTHELANSGCPITYFDIFTKCLAYQSLAIFGLQEETVQHGQLLTSPSFQQALKTCERRDRISIATHQVSVCTTNSHIPLFNISVWCSPMSFFSTQSNNGFLKKKKVCFLHLYSAGKFFGTSFDLVWGAERERSKYIYLLGILMVTYLVVL